MNPGLLRTQAIRPSRWDRHDVGAEIGKDTNSLLREGTHYEVLKFKS